MTVKESKLREVKSLSTVTWQGCFAGKNICLCDGQQPFFFVYMEAITKMTIFLLVVQEMP
jgi:hypothetical protein